MDVRERPMNANLSDNPSERMLCPKCKITHTIEHNDGQWCPRCGSFAIPPDPRHTAHIQTTRPSRASSFDSLRATAGARVLAQSVQGVGDLVTLATAFMMTVSGFVDVVSRAALEILKGFRIVIV